MYKVTNPNQTMALAKVVGEKAQPGDNVVLTGDLGAGKTTFTKGIAEGLGVSQMIKSPTYTIIREYDEGRIPLYHMDVYRVTEGADDLGLDDYFEGDGLSIIEWGNQLGKFVPTDYVEIVIEKDLNDSEVRVFSLIAHGARGEQFVDLIRQDWEKLSNE